MPRSASVTIAASDFWCTIATAMTGSFSLATVITVVVKSPTPKSARPLAASLSTSTVAEPGLMVTSSRASRKYPFSWATYAYASRPKVLNDVR
jgi:hypothetical protein